MTYAEFYLLRVFEAAWALPRDIIRQIIRNLNLRAKIQHRRRLRLPRNYFKRIGDPITEMERAYLGYIDDYYGPGF